MTQTLTREIKRYVVTYDGGGKKVTVPYPFRAIIALWDDSGMIGALYFHNDPNTMPDGDHLPDVGQPMSHYPIRRLPAGSGYLKKRKARLLLATRQLADDGKHHHQLGDDWRGEPS